MALPTRLGGLALTKPTTLTSECNNSQCITALLSTLIVLQTNDLGTTIKQQQDLKTAVKSERHRHQNATAADSKENLPLRTNVLQTKTVIKVLPVGCRSRGVHVNSTAYTVASLPVTIIISTALSISKKKLKIIEAVEKGYKSHVDVAKEFSVAKSTVRLLCSRKVQLESMQLSLL